MDFHAGFAEAVDRAQAYFRSVITVTPEAQASFHVRSAFPKRQQMFPNPHLLDAGSRQPASLPPR